MPILSFSVPEMLPSVAWGVLARGEIYQPDGADAFWDRITTQAGLAADTNTFAWMKAQGRQNKTQTIRPFDYENPNPRSWHSRIRPGDYCDIWWKQRAPKIGFKIGRVKLSAVHRINIRRYPNDSPRVQIFGAVLADLKYLPPRPLPSDLIMGEDLLALALADGFTSTEEFMDYFVPNPGGEFKGNLLAW